MNQQSNGDAADGVWLTARARDSRSSTDFKPGKPSQTAEEDTEPFDRERFPDGFYPGIIVFLDRVRGRGVIRSYSGRELRFEFPFVTVVGAPIGGRSPGIDLLHQGDRVGFDVGWTSKGLRVTKIKPAVKEQPTY
ncbi:MAG: hypothetical protein JO166_01000 [Deltaproteobacteria bacterium]|nr:hypothetical protein [Deltaproteobacteria bacterium]